MSSYIHEFLSAAHLLGKTAVPRNTYPQLRSGTRRSDPDGGSAVPYYAGVAALTLTINYSDAALADQSEDIVIGSNGYADIITQINAVDPTNLEASDADGFLVLRNLNAGGAHFIQIMPQAVAADDAAPVLGFRVDPYPGSLSYAGEIASAPGGRTQSNPQGTALLGRGEDLSSQSINRAVASALLFAERNHGDLAREILSVEEVSITLLNNAAVAAADGLAGGEASAAANVFVLDDPTIRIPVSLIEVANPGGELLEEFLKLELDQSELVLDVASLGQRFRVRSVHYSADATTPDFRDAANDEATFAAWGTPDNKSIFGTAVDLIQKDKHASVAITSIDGNLITCAGATFEDLFVQAGDTLVISGAANTSPWSHDGEYIVEAVWSNEVISVRSKLASEPLVFAASARPSGLNPTVAGSFGNVSVPVGHFLPASNLVFTLEPVTATGVTGWGLTTATPGDFILRIKAGTPFRETFAHNLAKDFSASPDKILDFVRGHIADTDAAHLATAIDWSGAAPVWATTGESVTGTTVQAILASLITQLGDASGTDGATRIGSAEVTAVVETSPTPSLAAGSVHSQILALLELLNAHESDSVAHAGAGSTYSGSPNWVDGESIAAGVTVDEALDEIVSDLAAQATGDDGAGKIGIAARTAWLGGRTNPAASVFAAIDKIITDLAATTASDDGSERVGAATNSELSSGSIRSQLTQLAAEWGRLTRSNTWSAAQTVNGTSGDGNAALITTASPVSRKLLWEVNLLGGLKGRLYAGQGNANTIGAVGLSGAFEMTVNAYWTGAAWDADDNGNTSSKYSFSEGVLTLGQRSAGAGTWADSGWSEMALGNAKSSSDSSSGLAKIAAVGGVDATVERTLMFEMRGIANHVRLYQYNWSSSNSKFEVTVNAYWTGTNWARDSAAISNLFRIGQGQFDFLHHSSGDASPWSDSTGWTSSIRIDPGGYADSYLQGQTDTIVPFSLIKAWATADCIGAAPDILAGFNIASMTYSGDYVVVTFSDDFVDANYLVLAGCFATDGRIASPGNAIAAGSVRIALNSAAGAAITLNASSEEIYVLCVGHQ